MIKGAYAGIYEKIFINSNSLGVSVFFSGR